MFGKFLSPGLGQILCVSCTSFLLARFCYGEGLHSSYHRGGHRDRDGGVQFGAGAQSVCCILHLPDQEHKHGGLQRRRQQCRDRGVARVSGFRRRLRLTQLPLSLCCWIELRASSGRFVSGGFHAHLSTPSFGSLWSAGAQPRREEYCVWYLAGGHCRRHQGDDVLPTYNQDDADVLVFGQVMLSSRKDRLLVVIDGKALSTIDGIEGCQLLCVYVMTGSSWGMRPKVEYIEIFGNDSDGGDAYEKKTNASSWR